MLIYCLEAEHKLPSDTGQKKAYICTGTRSRDSYFLA